MTNDEIDEQGLDELFRSAAAAPPPPRFDHGGVVKASRRVTMRNRVLAGAAGLLVVAGVGTAVGLPQLTGGSPTAASAPSAADGRAGAGEGLAREQAAPSGQLDAAAPTPLGPGTAPCADRQDPALRALVVTVLPDVAGAPAAATTMECRPAGERGVSLEVPGGLLVVAYLPPGTEPRLVAGAVAEATASGGTVVVSAGGVYADRAGALAAQLAPLL